MYTQEKLFDVDMVETNPIGAIYRSTGLSEVNMQILDLAPFVELEIKPGSSILQSRLRSEVGFISTYINSPYMDDYYAWSDWQRTEQRFFKGFIYGLMTLDDNNQTPFLHLATDITDMQVCCLGFNLNSIIQITEYEKNYRDVMVAYQNAKVDGSAMDPNMPRTLENYNNRDNWISRDKLSPFVKLPWVKKSVIYEV